MSTSAAAYWRATAVEAREMAKGYVHRPLRAPAPGERRTQLVNAAELLRAADTFDGYANILDLSTE